jgi:hypothetical protein
MDAVRRRLAPIRGIPTKSGKMADPNADIKEVFDFIDELPKAPAKAFDTIKRWVSGWENASIRCARLCRQLWAMHDVHCTCSQQYLRKAQGLSVRLSSKQDKCTL